ncbi:MAG: DNA polymerase III subunit gamma/tau [Ancalomicrobiaceae bacterium]|nr:DNA polymerase III subunit gamma/tau [Ancalomicrobiaceae bacterium]
MDGLFPVDATEAQEVKSGAYRVLARKYRPQSFDDLIGQEPMVRTLTNAFASGRIAQGYMLTGVRGVGKTTTARILARALNYEIPGKIDKPTIDMPELGVHCRAIMEGRHVDVIEMDAASHTGIGDIREIIEAVRYKPVSARMKVYVIDEVHMLSNAAFNGLLKTLEEPPEHVKFIFATTEIRKVPITVLSRCQRFDLRRIDADVLVKHLRRISDLEHVSIDDDALRLIARAAEGSARDALSLLDQAIAHGEGGISAEEVRTMLGLADRARIIDLFEKLMRGDALGALAELRGQYDVGADPAVVIADLAEFTHFVTRLKLVPEAANDAAASPDEVARGLAMAGGLSLRVLGRAWQILLKGYDEVRSAPKAMSAAEMLLIRLAYASDLPTPDEALKVLREGGAGAAAVPSGAPRGSGPAGATATSLIAPPVVSERAGTDSGGAEFGASTARAYAPDPAEPRAERAPVARLVASNPDLAPASAPVAATPAPALPAIHLASLADIAAVAAEKRDIMLKLAVERQMRPVKFEPGRIEIALTSDAPRDLVQDLARKLADWTGERWMVVVAREAGGATIAEEREAAHDRLMSDARADPLVAAVMRRFPGAKIVDVRIDRPTGAVVGVGPARVPDAAFGESETDDGEADDHIGDFEDLPGFEVDDPGWMPEE